MLNMEQLVCESRLSLWLMQPPPVQVVFWCGPHGFKPGVNINRLQKIMMAAGGVCLVLDM
jgi:hypothetical protein